jgi:exopolysaccharide production protein ExoY
VCDVASKTVSELSKLSANLTAFDLSVHEGGQVATSFEPAPARERPPRRAPTQPKPAAGKARRKPRGSRESGLSGLFSAVGTIDSLVPDPGVLAREPSSQPGPVGGAIKRALDIFVAAITLVLLSPLLLAVALLIRATMGRPVLFPQRRLGFDGRPFSCWKFRTMVKDAEATLRSYLDSDPEAAREWRTRQKLELDPRVTTLGRVLRRSSIDELPQLISVLLGRMSCVGPRPIVEAEVARYGRSWADYKRSRPGLTGLWQVSGRNRLTYLRRVALDRCYVRRWSVWLDLWILIKTIPAVLRPGDTT